MATTQETVVKFNWADNKSTTLRLPAPYNGDMKDEDTQQLIPNNDWLATLQAAYENDEGFSLRSAEIHIETTTTSSEITLTGGE